MQFLKKIQVLSSKVKPLREILLVEAHDGDLFLSSEDNVDLHDWMKEDLWVYTGKDLKKAILSLDEHYQITPADWKHLRRFLRDLPQFPTAHHNRSISLLDDILLFKEQWPDKGELHLVFNEKPKGLKVEKDTSWWCEVSKKTLHLHLVRLSQSYKVRNIDSLMKQVQERDEQAEEKQKIRRQRQAEQEHQWREIAEHVKLVNVKFQGTIPHLKIQMTFQVKDAEPFKDLKTIDVQFVGYDPYFGSAPFGAEILKAEGKELKIEVSDFQDRHNLDRTQRNVLKNKQVSVNLLFKRVRTQAFTFNVPKNEQQDIFQREKEEARRREQEQRKRWDEWFSGQQGYRRSYSPPPPRTAADPWATLEVPRGSSLEETKKKYKELMLKYHPDRPGGNLEKAQKINEAWDYLTRNHFTSKVHSSSVILSSMGLRTLFRVKMGVKYEV